VGVRVKVALAVTVTVAVFVGRGVLLTARVAVLVGRGVLLAVPVGGCAVNVREGGTVNVGVFVNRMIGVCEG
jgi:hypothetical protein